MNKSVFSRGPVISQLENASGQVADWMLGWALWLCMDWCSVLEEGRCEPQEGLHDVVG